jgi:hypothetical protein
MFKDNWKAEIIVYSVLGLIIITELQLILTGTIELAFFVSLLTIIGSIPVWSIGKIREGRLIKMAFFLYLLIGGFFIIYLILPPVPM